MDADALKEYLKEEDAEDSDVDLDKINKEYPPDLKKTAYLEFWEDLSKAKQEGQRGSASVSRGGRRNIDGKEVRMP